MKKLLPLILIAFSISAFGQTKPKMIRVEGPPPKPVASYDKFNDRTTVESAELRPEITNDYAILLPRFSAQITLVYAGQQMRRDQDDALLVIRTASKDWMFLRNNDAIIIADNRKIYLGQASRSGRVFTGGVSESLGYRLNIADMTALAKASSVELQVGIVQAKVKDADLVVFKDILAAATKD